MDCCVGLRRQEETKSYVILRDHVMKNPGASGCYMPWICVRTRDQQQAGTN